MVIINGKLYTMEGRIIENGFVRTRGNKIEEVGAMETFTKTLYTIINGEIV